MSKDIKSDENDDSILLEATNNDKIKVMDLNYLSMSKSLTALQMQQLEQQQQLQLRRLSEQSASNRFGQVSLEKNFRAKEPSVIDKWDAMKSAYESNIEPDCFSPLDKYPLGVKYTNTALGTTFNKNSVKQSYHPLILKKKKSYVGISNEKRFNKVSISKSRLKFISSYTGFNTPTPSLDNYNKSFKNKFKITKKSSLKSYKYQKILLANAKTFPKERENSLQKKILLAGSMARNRPSPMLKKLKYKSCNGSKKFPSSQVEKSKPAKKVERIAKDMEKSISIKDKFYLRKKLPDKMVNEHVDEPKRTALNKISKEMEFLQSKKLSIINDKLLSNKLKKSDPVLNKSGKTLAQSLMGKISKEFDKNSDLETVKFYDKAYKLFEKIVIKMYDQIMDKKPHIQQASKTETNSTVTALSSFKSSDSAVTIFSKQSTVPAVKGQLIKKTLQSIPAHLPEGKKEQKSRTRSSEARAAARAVSIKIMEAKKTTTEQQLTNDDFEDLNDALGDLNTAINTLKNSYGSIICSLANMQARRCKKALQNIMLNKVNKCENKIVEEMMKQYSKYINLSTVFTPATILKTPQVFSLNEIQIRAQVIDYEEKYKVDKFLDPQQHDDIFQILFKEIEEINIAFVQFGTFFDPEGYFQSDQYYKQTDFRLTVKQHQDFMKMFSKLNTAVGKVLKAYNTDLLNMFRIQSLT